MAMSYSEKQEAIIQSTGNNRVQCKGWTGGVDYNGARTSPNGTDGQWKGATLVMGGHLKWQPEQASWWHEYGAVKNMGALQGVWGWKWFQTTQSWFVFMEQTGNSNNNLEMRGNIRNMTFWVLRKGQSTWEQWQNTSDIYWGNYFAYSMQSAVGRNPRFWREGSHSVITIEGQLRSVSHFGPAVISVRSPETVEAVMVTAEVRMDPSMPAGTKLAVHIGGDHKWIGDGAFMNYYPGMGVSQLQDLGREWKRIYYVSLEGAQNDMPSRRITHARFLSSTVPMDDMRGGANGAPVPSPAPAPQPQPSPSPSPTPSPSPAPYNPTATDSYYGIPRPTTFSGLPGNNNFFWIKKRPGVEPDSNAWYVEFKGMHDGRVMSNWDTEQDVRLMANRNNWDPVNWKWPAYVDTSGADLPRDLSNIKVQWITVDRNNMNSVSPHNTIGIGEDYITYWGEDGRNIVARAQLKESNGGAAPTPPPAPTPSPTPNPAPMPQPTPVPTGPKVLPYTNAGYVTTSNEYNRLWGPAANGHVTNLSNTTIGPNKYTSFRFRAQRGGQVSTLQLYWQGGSGYAAGNGGNIKVTICNDDGTSNHFPNLGSVVGTFWFKPNRNTGSIFDAMRPTGTTTLAAGRLYHIVCENMDSNPGANYFSNNSRGMYHSTGARPNRMAALTDCETLYNPVGSGWRSLTVGYSNFHRQPIYGIRFTDGGEIGETQMEAASQIGRTAFEWTSSRYGRELFDPQPRDMAFSGLSVAASTTGGTLSITIGHAGNANLYTYDLVRGNNRKTEGANISVSPWEDIEFPSTITIPKNTQFWVQLKPKSGTWYISAARRGQDLGLAGAWSQSHFQQFVNGSWQGYNKWNAGGNWIASGRSTDSLPVYFTLATTTSGGGGNPGGGGGNGDGGGGGNPPPAVDKSTIITGVQVESVTRNLVRFNVTKKYGAGTGVKLLNIERYGNYGQNPQWWPKASPDGLHKSEWVPRFEPYFLMDSASSQTILYTFDHGKINMRNVFVFDNGQRITVTANNESQFDEEKPATSAGYKIEYYSQGQEPNEATGDTIHRIVFRVADTDGTTKPVIQSVTFEDRAGKVTRADINLPFTWDNGVIHGRTLSMPVHTPYAQAMDSRVLVKWSNDQTIVANIKREAGKSTTQDDKVNGETDSIYEGTLGQQSDGLAVIITRKPSGTNQWGDWLAFVELRNGKIVRWPNEIILPAWSGLKTFPAVIIDHNGRMQDEWEKLSVATVALSNYGLFAESDSITGVKWYARGSGYRLSTTELSTINGRQPRIIEDPTNYAGSVGEAVPSGISTFVWVRYVDEDANKIRFQYVPYLNGKPYTGPLNQSYYDSITFDREKGFPAIVWPGNRLPAGDIARNMRRAYITLDSKFANNVQMHEATGANDFSLTNWAKSETLDARGNRYQISDLQVREWYLGTGDAGNKPSVTPAPIPQQGEIDWTGVNVRLSPNINNSFRFRVSVDTPLYGKQLTIKSIQIPGHDIASVRPVIGAQVGDGTTITVTPREEIQDKEATAIVTLEYSGSGDRTYSWTIPLQIDFKTRYLPIPEKQFTERWDFNTGIIRTFAGERRACLRLTPRVWLKYDFRFDSLEEMEHVYGYLIRQQSHWGRVFDTILASRMSSITDLSTGSNVVYGSNLSSGDYPTGKGAIIMTPSGTTHDVKVQSVGIGNLTLQKKSPITARNAYIAPNVNVQAVKGIQMKIGAGINDYAISAEMMSIENPYVDQNMSGYTTHNGLYIMHKPIVDAFSIDTSKLAEEVDNGTSKPNWINNTRHVRHRRTVKFMATTIKEVDLLKNFFINMKGRYTPFWLPTYENFATASGLTHLGNGAIALEGDVTQRIGAGGNLGVRYKKNNCNERYIFGGIVASVQYVNDHLGSRTMIAFDIDPFGGNSVARTAIELVTTLHKVRLDTDSIEFEYDGRDKMTVSVSVISVP